jgi:hypothetical protein
MEDQFHAIEGHVMVDDGFLTEGSMDVPRHDTH